MEALIVEPKNKKELQAIKAVLKALDISFRTKEERPYDPEFVAKIKKSEQQIKEGKVTRVKKEDLKIDLNGNMLRVSGERKREIKEEGYYERSSGRFSRSFTLPENVDASKIEANFEDGVLRIVLPKTEVKGSQEIKVQSGQPQGLIDRFLHREKTVKTEEKTKEKEKH